MQTTSTPASGNPAALLHLDALENGAYPAPRVLVVDDNDADAAVLAALLSDRARVTTATTIRAALDTLDTLDTLDAHAHAHETTDQAPDCVLLALGLPDTQTEIADAVAAIATRHPRIPVMVITGQEDDELGMEAVAAGAQDVLVMGTFDGPALMRRIRFATERKRVWWSVVRADRRHRRILDRAGVGVWLGTSDGETTYVNTRLAGLLGLDDNDLIGHSLTSVIARSDQNAADALLADAVGTHAFVSLVRADGSSLPVSLTVSRAEDEPNELVAFVTDLRGVRQGPAALVDNSWDIISVHDRHGRLQWTSAAATKLLGVPAGDAAAGTSIIDRIDPDDINSVNDAFRGWRDGGACTVAYRVIDDTGAIRHVESVGSNMLDHPGIGGIVVTTRDVTDRHEAQQELAFAALHDRLTRLPNRLLLLDRIGQAVDAARATSTSVAVVYLDLDHFKVVNESLGYDVGDALLVAVGNELSAVVRPGDTVSRIGGDGFAICLQGLAAGDPDDDPCAIASGMLRRLAELPDLGGEPLFIGASAGVAINDAHSDAEQLLSDAEAAMYRAKELGRGRVELFDAEARARVIGRLVLQAELRNALHRDEFRLFFQPQVRIATGEIAGFEALLRWHHPERGLLAPAAFIDVAEESGLIEPIGRWVLEDACRQVAEWRQRFAETRLRVSVNLSARQLVDDTLPDIVARVLHNAGIDPSALCLELTESMLMEDAEHAVATLRRLKETGVRLAIDDFGTGYSSLAYLKRFPIDELKVDRSFVAGLGRDPEDFVIVSAVANLATSLGVEMVAEGVENVRHLTELESLGCPLAQGYLWSPPVPAAAVPALLARPVVRPTHGPSTPADPPGAATNARAQAHQAIDVVSLLAHELRAPLTVIRGYAETMTAHLDGSSPTVGRACAAIARNVTHLDDLVATLTDVNALEAGTLPLHRQPTDVTHVVRTLLADHGGLFVDNPVTVDVTSEDTEAYVDGSRLHQILLNLLTNAAKFSPAGERITVVIADDASDDDLHVRVVDNGHGVAPELSREIFRKFFRADHAKKGTGLGLYVARSLARAHGGELACRQAPGGGAEFVLTLPRVHRRATSMSTASATDAAPRSVADTAPRPHEPDLADEPTDDDPALAATLSTAYAALDEAETPEQAVGAVITLLRDLGGGTVVARDADATALPYEVSCGIGEATLASAPPGSDQRATIERVLPQLLETSSATVRRTSAIDHGPEPRIDQVTGFAGRRLAARAIARLRDGSGVVLVGADGDDGLRALGRLVRSVVPRHAWVGRFGDDRIAILFPVGPDTAPAETAALLCDAWASRYPAAPALDAGTAVVGRRGTEVALVTADAASRSRALAGTSPLV